MIRLTWFLYKVTNKHNILVIVDFFLDLNEQKIINLQIKNQLIIIGVTFLFSFLNIFHDNNSYFIKTKITIIFESYGTIKIQAFISYLIFIFLVKKIYI